MKGRSRTAAVKRFHDQLCSLGCVACYLDGRHNTHCLIHHVDGRTKPWAHWFVLPLCSGHHADGTGAPGLIAVHPWKVRFEVRYGTQPQLLTICLDRLDAEWGIVVPDARLAANGEFWKMVA